MNEQKASKKKLNWLAVKRGINWAMTIVPSFLLTLLSEEISKLRETR
ncbi:hypothetical protein M1146_00150 [Patescibacteria group bacterium]|nr:hypothetical protein [Patescibacteria group bacterium]